MYLFFVGADFVPFLFYYYCATYVYFFTDCHAEIVSRRCLLSFLYSQLEKISEDPSATSIFVSRQPDGGGYKLKPEVRFHLYINTG